MAQIDFYLVTSGGTGGAERVACRIVEKAYGGGQKIYVHTAYADQCERVNALLWTFRQESFIPHQLADTKDATGCPVVIGHDGRQAGVRQVLVNLSASIPAFAIDYQRLAEVVADDEQSREAGRRRYAAYRRQGHELKHHEVHTP